MKTQACDWMSPDIGSPACLGLIVLRVAIIRSRTSGPGRQTPEGRQASQGDSTEIAPATGRGEGAYAVRRQSVRGAGATTSAWQQLQAMAENFPFGRV